MRSRTPTPHVGLVRCVLTAACRQERQSYRTIAANAWLYLMRAPTWTPPPPLPPRPQKASVLCVSVCVYSCLLFSWTLPGDYLGKSMICTSSRCRNTQVTQTTGQCDAAPGRVLWTFNHTQVFLQFFFPLSGFYDTFYFLFGDQTLCAFSIALNLTLVFFFLSSILLKYLFLLLATLPRVNIYINIYINI